MNYKEQFIERLGHPVSDSKLEDYLDFVLTQGQKIVEHEYSEMHHILPRSIFGENSHIYRLNYSDHITAHRLLVDAYPIREFIRPLNFMLPRSDKNCLEFRKLISESAKKSWQEFKKTDKYTSWRKKKSELMIQRNLLGLSKHASEKRYTQNQNAKQEISEHFKTLWKDQEYRNRVIASMLAERSTPEAKDRYKKAIRKRWDNINEDELLKFKEVMSKVNKNENKRKTASIKIKEKWKTEEFKNKMKTRKPRGSDGSAIAKKWADPVWKENMLRIRKENKLKRKFNETD
jgi:hypothetical protein